MNNLLYKLLLNHASKRKIAILSMLLEYSDPLSLKYLEKKCKTTRKTLEQDVQELVADPAANLEMTTYNQKISIKKKTTNSDILVYMDSLISESPLLLVIESIFSSDQETITSLAEKLFITESTLRKYLTTLKKVLKEYDLSISSKPLDIIGNEGNIRYFYFVYFEHVRKKQLLPISSEKNTYLYNLLNDLIQHGTVLSLDYQRLTSWSMIHEKRVSQGKTIRFSEDILDKYIHNYGFSTLKLSLNTIIQKNSPLYDLDTHEMLYIYLTSFDNIIYSKHNQFFVNDLAPALDEFNSLVTKFFKTADLNFSHNLELKSMLQAFLANLTALTDISPLFQKNECSLKRVAEKKHLETLTQWHDLLIQDGRFLYPYDIAISLTLITESQKFKRKRILFAITGEPASISYFRELALKVTPSDAEILFHFNQPLDNLVLKKRLVDICVYNFTPIVPLSEAELIRLSEIPIETEWNDLLIRLHNI